MFNRPSPVTLRVEPHTIPALRAAFYDAADALNEHVTRLQEEGQIKEPWLGDETSSGVYSYYKQNVMDVTNGPIAALAAFSTELMAVHDTLKRMEDEYRRSEGDNTALWGRRV